MNVPGETRLAGLASRLLNKRHAFMQACDRSILLNYAREIDLASLIESHLRNLDLLEGVSYRARLPRAQYW